MLGETVMWIIQMWVSYRSDEVKQVHIIPKTWAQNKKINYFCSDTAAFQQFLQLALKRTLPALTSRWLILAGSHRAGWCGSSAPRALLGGGNQRDSDRNRKSGEMALNFQGSSVIQFPKDGLSSHGQTRHRTRGVSAQRPFSVFAGTLHCSGKPWPRSLSQGKGVMWAAGSVWDTQGTKAQPWGCDRR